MNTGLMFSLSECEALRGLGVTAVILFGSKAVGLDGVASDYDVGIILEPQARQRDNGVIYDKLYELLTQKIGLLVNIDIVFLDKAPLELQMHVARHGQAILEVIPGTFTAYKETVMDQYADFAPIRQMFHEQILGRIPS